MSTTSRLFDMNVPEEATPVLMLWGGRDAFASPEWGEDLAARIPSMRLVRIPDAGHLPWIDDPQRIVSETESFLAG